VQCSKSTIGGYAAGYRFVYSEDLNQGQKYGDLVVIDPFLKGS
jgi:predicted nucleic acid-binding protein